jgi:hypothetical protein
MLKSQHVSLLVSCQCYSLDDQPEKPTTSQRRSLYSSEQSVKQAVQKRYSLEGSHVAAFAAVEDNNIDALDV